MGVLAVQEPAWVERDHIPGVSPPGHLDREHYPRAHPPANLVDEVQILLGAEFRHRALVSDTIDTSPNTLCP